MSRKKAKVLLVEDEDPFRELMVRSFGDNYHFVHSRTAKGAMTSAQRENYDLILLDLTLLDNEQLGGLDHIEPMKRYASGTPLIVVTKDQKTQTVVEAMNKGADYFIRKDEFNLPLWKRLFDKYIRNKPEADQEIVKGEGSKRDIFIGESPQILEIKDKLRRLSEFPDVTVLITGETGVGKEVAACYLHAQGPRLHQPFKAINLTAVSKTLMESELFGHKKGAFTHAVADQDGAFLQADGGVLLLDEIGEVSQNIQVKLLRFLENKVITPVGGSDIQLNLQILAATNKDLPLAVAEGKFREDLYYRLNQYEIVIPPLRERREDINLLIDHYLTVMNERPDVLTPEARHALLNYSWPGNVRQLVNALKKMVVDKVMKSRKFITVDLFPDDMKITAYSMPEVKPSSALPQTENRIPISVPSVENEMAVIELTRIEAALKKHIKKRDAAEELGWDLDKLKYTIVNKYYEHFPELVRRFPTICKKYKRFIE